MARKPKYRRHTARNRGFVEFNGKRHYLPGPYKSPESVAAYRRFLRENVHLELTYDTRAVLVVGHLVLRFESWAEGAYPPGPRSEYVNCHAAFGHLSESDLTTPVNEFGPLKLKDLMNRMAKAKATRTYINSVASRIKRMFKWGASEELVPGHVYHALATVAGIRKGRTTAREPRKKLPVEWDWVAATLTELSPTVAAMVLFQWYTGARSQSVCGARVSQFTKGKLWEWRPKHKTEGTHDVVLYIGPRCQEVIKPFIKGDFLFQPKHQNGKRAKGFRSFYDSVSYLRAVSRAINRVNAKLAEQEKPPIPSWTPHQLRHTRGTLVRAQHGLEAAQATLGHATLHATQIYAQKHQALAKLVAEQMG